MRTGKQSRGENKSKKAIAKRSYLTASFLIRMDCRQDVSSLEFVETALNIFATSCHVLQIPIGETSNIKFSARFL